MRAHHICKVRDEPAKAKKYCPPSAPCGYWVDMAYCPMETGCGGVSTIETQWTCRHGTLADNDATTIVEGYCRDGTKPAASCDLLKQSLESRCAESGSVVRYPALVSEDERTF